MFDIQKIKEGLEVVGSDNAHLGTVDHFSGTQLKLKKNDAGSGGSHHYLSTDLIADVGEKIVLTVSADEARQQWAPTD
ncbi:DUF2171 domain-containing protein [Bosea sp. CCNWLW174]|jgi:hypothetical protein|uniref:DUF2171 domain-containing protein n=1 Tax=unclassified Bosea (in: a-proteobacteria) TaxID=2653178 RepID=UPI0030142042